MPTCMQLLQNHVLPHNTSLLLTKGACLFVYFLLDFSLKLLNLPHAFVPSNLFTTLYGPIAIRVICLATYSNFDTIKNLWYYIHYIKFANIIFILNAHLPTMKHTKQIVSLFCVSPTHHNKYQ